jgi:hypothetical protein
MEKFPTLGLSFGTKEIISDIYSKKIVDYKTFEGYQPSFIFEHRARKYYAILLYNMRTNKPYLFTVNAYDGWADKSTILFPYSIPREAGEYHLVVYEQKNRAPTVKLVSLKDIRAFVESQKMTDWTEGRFTIIESHPELFVNGSISAPKRKFCSIKGAINEEGRETEVIENRVKGKVSPHPARDYSSSITSNMLDNEESYECNEMTDAELMAFAKLRGISVKHNRNGILDRKALLSTIAAAEA